MKSNKVFSSIKDCALSVFIGGMVGSAVSVTTVQTAAAGDTGTLSKDKGTSDIQEFDLGNIENMDPEVRQGLDGAGNSLGFGAASSSTRSLDISNSEGFSSRVASSSTGASSSEAPLGDYRCSGGKM